MPAAGVDSSRSSGRPSLKKAGLPPIVNARARILILGTLPGDESLRLQQYYGHPRNHFWPIISGLTGEHVPKSYARRVALLKRSAFSLWDVLQSADRAGSLDAAIRNGEANAFADFFARFPRIRIIAFNGQKARALFRGQVMADQELAARDLTAIVLPSSSPTHVRPFEEKLDAWRTALAPLQNFRAR